MSQNYYNQIKTELINNEAYKRVKDYSKNRSDLAAYYTVGKIIIEAQGGEKRANDPKSCDSVATINLEPLRRTSEI